jgi:hypothetical protein
MSELVKLTLTKSQIDTLYHTCSQREHELDHWSGSINDDDVLVEFLTKERMILNKLVHLFSPKDKDYNDKQHYYDAVWENING